MYGENENTRDITGDRYWSRVETVKMSMNAASRAAAVELIDEVTAHPVTSVFVTKLLQVKQATNNGEYETVQSWLDAINAIWSMFDNEPDNVYKQSVANECRRVFMRKLRQTGLNPVDSWSTAVFELQKKIEKRRFAVPVKYRQYFSKKGKRRDVKDDQELLSLAEALRNMSDEDLVDVALLLVDTNDYKDEGMKDMWIDLSSLKPKTIEKLKVLVAQKQSDT